MATCEDCGCKVYNGHCVNCHEETYIAEQNAENDEPISFSKDFRDKIKQQEKEAVDIIEKMRMAESKEVEYEMV